MAAALDLHLIETPPKTVRMNINQVCDKDGTVNGSILVHERDLISVVLEPGAVVEFFAEGWHIASFQVTEDGKGVYATEGLCTDRLHD